MSIKVVTDDTGLIAIEMRTKDGKRFAHPLSVKSANALIIRLNVALLIKKNIQTKPASPSDVLPANAASPDAGRPHRTERKHC